MLGGSASVQRASQHICATGGHLCRCRIDGTLAIRIAPFVLTIGGALIEYVIPEITDRLPGRRGAVPTAADYICHTDNPCSDYCKSNVICDLHSAIRVSVVTDASPLSVIEKVDS
jgi:hypothetical protein